MAASRVVGEPKKSLHISIKTSREVCENSAGYPSGISATSIFLCVRQLCFEAISKFSPTLLSPTRPSLRAGAVVPPKEAEYTHELSRACYHILGQNLFLTPEWRGSSSNGQVDFYIKSVKWAIECVREGDRLDQHIARFQPGGLYYPLIATEEILDYILLDFRTSKPNKNRGMFAFSPSSTNVNRLDDIPFLYFIVFSKDYTSYEIYDAKLNPLSPHSSSPNCSLPLRSSPSQLAAPPPSTSRHPPDPA
jgi:hypothetical protein